MFRFRVADELCFFSVTNDSEKLDKYYIRSTSDPEGRLQRHNTSKKGFTSTGKPWELKYYETFESKHEALSRELQIKSWKDRDMIQGLISSAG